MRMREPRVPLEVTSLEAVINDSISWELVQNPILLRLGNVTRQLETSVLSSLRTDLVHEHLASKDVKCVNLCSRAGGEAGKSGGRE
jgi:hypothetical protein